MSTTYHIVCKTCNEKYWAGQRNYLYDKEHIAKFLHEHLSGEQEHTLLFVDHDYPPLYEMKEVEYELMRVEEDK